MEQCDLNHEGLLSQKSAARGELVKNPSEIWWMGLTLQPHSGSAALSHRTQPRTQYQEECWIQVVNAAVKLFCAQECLFCCNTVKSLLHARPCCA